MIQKYALEGRREKLETERRFGRHRARRGRAASAGDSITQPGSGDRVREQEEPEEHATCGRESISSGVHNGVRDGGASRCFTLVGHLFMHTFSS